MKKKKEEEEKDAKNRNFGAERRKSVIGNTKPRAIERKKKKEM